MTDDLMLDHEYHLESCRYHSGQFHPEVDYDKEPEEAEDLQSYYEHAALSDPHQTGEPEDDDSADNDISRLKDEVPEAYEPSTNQSNELEPDNYDQETEDEDEDESSAWNPLTRQPARTERDAASENVPFQNYTRPEFPTSECRSAPRPCQNAAVHDPSSPGAEDDKE